MNPPPGGADLSLDRPSARQRLRPETADASTGRGFAAEPQSRRPPAKRRRRGQGKLSPGDWGPLGKHPDLDAIVARQRLGLPLSGRISVASVNQAWKRAAAEHHPDRGGVHATMQAINGARDLLLGRHDD
jgi:hypothetical protein